MRRCCGNWSTSRPTRACTGWPGTPESGTRRGTEREEFLFGVDRILDGVQALIDRSRMI